MLIHLSLKHFVFINELALDFQSGMTVLTGETGAGKSILCDALWLALGEAGDRSVIQSGKPYCSIQAIFNIDAISHLKQWLIEKGYSHQAMGGNTEKVLCDITRTISQKGRGQVWINHKIATLKDVQWLGAQLVSRHSQHDQQRLLLSDYQRACLDQYGQHVELLHMVESHYKEYIVLKRVQQNLLEQVKAQKEMLGLLQYQLEELERTQLKPNEFSILEKEQRQLTHAYQVLEKGQEALFLLSEAEPTHLTALLQNIQRILHRVAQLDIRFASTYEAVERASLDITEMEASLRYTLSEVIVDPDRLNEVDERLAQLYNLAKKHGVGIETLPELTIRLKEKYHSYEEKQTELAACETALITCLANYESAAMQLTQARTESATRLAQAVTGRIQSLGMLGGQFEVQFKSSSTDQETKKPSSSGNERVIFYLSASPGQPLESLEKGASGGELSRLSLVIKTLLSEIRPVSTLIFDEVDIGVGGSVAERMGLLLEELSSKQQVLCITHLPQVAVLAQHHYRINKKTHDQTTTTQVLILESVEERIQEIARMLGGIHITDKTIAHAKSMLMVEPNS